METSTATKPTTSVQSELVQRHKATARTVKALLIAVVLLCVLAFVSKKFLTEQTNPSLHMAVLITILVLGLGAIAFRRTRFATMRLQDIAALRGPSGLLITLQRTTLQIALIGATSGRGWFRSYASYGQTTLIPIVRDWSQSLFFCIATRSAARGRGQCSAFRPPKMVQIYQKTPANSR